MIHYKGRSFEASPDIDTGHVALNEAIHQFYSNRSLTIQTSGSTGKPKTIELASDVLQWSAENTRSALNLSDEHCLICLPLNRIGGRMMLIRSLHFDWEVTYQEASSNPLLVVDNQRFYSFISLTPHQLYNVVHNPASLAHLSRAKTILIGGGALPITTEEIILNHPELKHIAFWQSYGMTETASHIALRNCRKHPPNQYTAVDSVKITTDDRTCLAISLEQFDLHVQTNDLVELIDNRTFKVLGRVDDVVNSGGVKIQLNDVHDAFEQALMKQQLACTYFFWKQPDRVLGEQLVFIGLNHANQEAIVRLLHQLPGYFKPKTIFWLTDFNWLVGGKIDRSSTAARAFASEKA